MSVTFGNANYRKKFDAFRIIDQSGHEPLKNAISCALRLRESAEIIEKALESCSQEDRAKLALELVKCVPNEFAAWIKIAEFVYAKPRQLTVDGNLTVSNGPVIDWSKFSDDDLRRLALATRIEENESPDPSRTSG